MKTLWLYLIVLGSFLLVGFGVIFLRPSRPVVTQAPLETVTQPPAAPVLEISSEFQQLHTIDPSQSEASYSVNEVILQTVEGRTVVGKTKGISGRILFDSTNTSNSQLGKLTIDVERLTSDSSLRDDRIRKSFLESSKYPGATFIAETLRGLPDRLEPNQTYNFQIEAGLTQDFKIC